MAHKGTCIHIGVSGNVAMFEGVCIYVCMHVCVCVRVCGCVVCACKHEGGTEMCVRLSCLIFYTRAGFSMCDCMSLCEFECMRECV